MKKSPLNKSRKKIAQDYARNAMYDEKHGYKKEGKYEAKQAVRAASGAPVRMESSAQEKKNLLQDMPIDKKASALNNLNKGYGSQVKSPMKMQGSLCLSILKAIWLKVLLYINKVITID